jgi:hypothetical protein
MLGDPGINLVASRDFPWHGSKKAGGEVSTQSWISERVDRERASGNFQKKFKRSPSHGRPHFHQQHRHAYVRPLFGAPRQIPFLVVLSIQFSVYEEYA